MPKSPILSREAFYENLADGTIRLQDFCLVETSLGAMIEPRSMGAVSDPNRVVAVDVYDASVNRLSPLNENEFYKLTGFSGQQRFLNWNR